MPLLKKKIFEKYPLPENLQDEEEIFYCEVTGEIFRDYEEFSERMFLYNSMVWTCSLTGKSNLTYQEALESEENAKQYLKEFSVELRLPVLFLANKTQRTSFLDMAEDIYIYMKDRYFIGENLEFLYSGSKWKDCHVLQVFAPSEHQLESVSAKRDGSDYLFLRPSLYRYEVEHLHTDDSDISEIMILDSNQLRRKKAVFNREKCKLFLKQYVEQDIRGLLVLKPSVLDAFSINKMNFEQIFDGPLPVFQTSRKLNKNSNENRFDKKKAKQETLTNFLVKSNGTKSFIEKSFDLLEQMKRHEEEIKLKHQKEQDKLVLKKKQKERYLKISSYIKNWYKTKDDLLLEDQKKLPILTPIKCKVPEEHLGDMLMIMEFVEDFSKVLHSKDFFPSGLTLELMERSLSEKEIAGPFIDIIQMFLTAIFNFQDEESTQYKTETEAPDIKEEYLSDNLSVTEAIRLGTFASTWSNKYQGLSLARLPLYSVTVSEILRLHLLSSGARINESGARWRFTERGGYTSEDDPGIDLRIHYPHILKALSIHNVVQLSVSDKIRILSCLMNQLLTYADVRDIIEERLEKMKQLRVELRHLQVSEKRRKQEYLATKIRLQKEMKDNREKLQIALEQMDRESEKKQIKNSEKITKVFQNLYDLQPYMGSNRAHQKYLRLNSVPGIFVCSEEEHFNICLNEFTKQIPELMNVTRQQLLQHAKYILFSTKKTQKLDTLNKMKNVDKDNCQTLLMCSADSETCPIHSCNQEKPVWTFFSNKFELEELEHCLNKRGVRENQLLQVIRNDKDRLLAVLSQTPVNILNQTDKGKEIEQLRQLRKKVKNRYEDANLGYPADMSLEEVLENALLDNILEMEEKIYAGNLGSLPVKNRDEWRNSLLHKNYHQIEQIFLKNVQKLKKSEICTQSSCNIREIEYDGIKCYQDPGKFIGVSDRHFSTDNEISLVQSEELQKSIKCLAIAVLQMAYAVDSKYLKKPLGHADLSKQDKKQNYGILHKWEQSLLASTSYSQIFLHYGTLDSCVMWSRSVLRARCRICRRQKDSENMLLCDNCNLGHHLYCLKPKLTFVPKGNWFCERCKHEKEKNFHDNNFESTVVKKRRLFIAEDTEDEKTMDNEEYKSEIEEEESGGGFGDTDDTNDSRENEMELCKICELNGELITCEKCSANYHIECCEPPLRRAPRGSWLCNLCKDRYSDSGEEQCIRRSYRREDNRDDLPLHNVLLQELLSAIMKQEDAWPFLRPVQTKEVPDYYDVISTPMDFGTVKYKLNMGEYNTDNQLMQDILLIFENCKTYNDPDAQVYKCGMRLWKYLVKKSHKLGLKLTLELENE